MDSIDFYETLVKPDRIPHPNEEALIRMIETVVSEWQQELSKRGLSFYNTTRNSPAYRGNNPPLITRLKSDVTDFNEMLRLLYSVDVGEDDILDAWDAAMAAFFNRPPSGYFVRETHAPFNKAFPGFVFTGSHFNPIEVGVQFLKLASWCEGFSLSLASQRAILTMPSGRAIGFDHQAVLSPTKSFRTRAKVFDYTDSLYSKRGVKGSTPRSELTRGAYWLLCNAMPERREEISLVFNIAVQAGVVVEYSITRWFYIKVGAGRYKAEVPEEVRAAALIEASYLIENSRANPRAALYAKLVPLYGARTFNGLFPKGLSRYPQHVKEEFRAGLLRLQTPTLLSEEEKKDNDLHKMLSHFFGV